MAAAIKSLATGTLLSLLVACAGGGGGAGEVEVTRAPTSSSAQEEQQVCTCIGWACLIYGCMPVQYTGSGQGQTAPQYTYFSSWSELQRDRVTWSETSTSAIVNYETLPDGRYRVDFERMDTGQTTQVYYDAQGRPVHFALGGGDSWFKTTVPISDLAAAGLPWLDYRYDNQPPSGVVLSSDPNTSFVTLAAREIEFLANPYVLGWNYQSFGFWDSTHLGDRSFGGKSFGSSTPAAAVPASGAASFVGKLGGLYTAPDGRGSVATADLRVDVDFAARSLNFASTGTQAVRELGAPGAAAPSLNLSGTLSYSPGTNAFNGTLVNAGATLSGQTQGRFYGPGAQELGGAFNLDAASGTEKFVGAYGARR